MPNEKIEQMLKRYEEGKTLSCDLEKIKLRAIPLLKKIAITFPEYTSHDIEHSERIIEQFNNLFSDKLKEKLNEYELYFFIASAYLHDIGMIKTKNDDSTDPEELKQIIRENHHIRSEDYIVTHYKELGIDNEHQANIIGRICRGHRKENLHDQKIFNSNKAYKNIPINIPFLSALLRISDEFDLSFNRVQELMYHNIEFDNSISECEWTTHLSISGVFPQPDDPTLIVGSAKCKDPQIHRKLKNIETKINIQLEELPDHLHHYRDIKRELPIKFRIDIESEGYKAYDFKFSLQEREIIKMLMGEKLYRRKEESIRELLKNSIDACRMRKELLKKEQMDLTSIINFKVSPDNSTLEVSDNGMGMDDEIVETYFTKIGKSFYKSKDFLNQNLKFAPVSELGIGFLSCFMIAERIVIDTKMEDKQGLIIEIDDLSDYFFIRDSTKKEPGTTIVLTLREDSKTINFFEEVRTFASHLDIEINFYHKDLSKSIIKNDGFRDCLTKNLGKYSKSHSVKEIKIDCEYIEGTIGFIYLKSGSNYLIQLPYQYYGWEFSKYLPSIEEKNKSSFEGIFVNNSKGLIPAWLKVDVFDLNIKESVVDLNVSRNDFIINEKYHKFMDNFEKLIIKEIKKIVASELKILNLDEIQKKEALNRFISRFCITQKYIQEQIEEKLKPSDNLISFLRDYQHYWIIDDYKIKFLNSREIAKLGKKLFNVGYLFNVDYLQYVIKNCSDIPKEDVCYGLFSYFMFKDYLFPDLEHVELYSYLQITKFKDLKKYLPGSWNVGRFNNYNTTRFFELIHYKKTTLNREHPFVNLIICNLNILTPDKKIALEGFFKGIKQDCKKDLSIVIDKQTKILNWYVKKRIISKEDLSVYLLTVEDFPPGYLQYK
jgi:hypothetical protein